LKEASLPREKATLGWPFSLALNHLLDAEPWAKERLAPFAGETIELRAPPLPRLRFTILPGGRLGTGEEGEASLVITLKPEILPALPRGMEHVLRAIEVFGNARLANEVMFLVRHLRWDAEEDLSRLVGDVAAHRLAQVAHDFAAWQADAARRIAEAAADYFLDEQPMLVRRADLTLLADGVAALRDAVERLEQRVRRLG